MADARRAEFPDKNKPLYTPDADAQQQVVERIEQARKGKQKRKPRKKAQGKADYVITLDRLPMGQHSYVSREQLAKAWGVGHSTAGNLVKHPERLDPYQVPVLCECLGVTKEWLRGWTDENAFGRYESADTVAALYGRLSNKDREMVSGLLKRLAGADIVAEVKHEQWVSDNEEWAKRHPREVAKINEVFRRTVAQFAASTATVQRAYDAMQSAADAAMQPLRDAMQGVADVAQAIKDQYTDEEWQLMRETNERLKAQGVDTKGMTPQQLLDIARGDSVEELEGPAS